MRRDSGENLGGQSGQPGHEILRETKQLLGQMSFWSNRGAYAEGRYVAISVDPSWNADNETIQVSVTCYALGHPAVDWQALPVWARPTSGENMHGIAHLDTRGQALIPRLQPDDYRLFVPERHRRSDAPLAFNSDRAGQAEGNLAAATDILPDSFEPHIDESPDGSVVATVRRTAENTIIVAFETEEAELAGAVVHFVFLRTSGEILHSAAVTFEPIEEEPGLLEARWEAEIDLAERCTFEFGVIPRDA